MSTTIDPAVSKLTARALAERLREERLKSLELMGQFSAPDLELVSQIRGRTLRDMLWMLHEHYRVHRTQIHNNRISAGNRTNEINALMACAQESFESALSDLVGLSEQAADHIPAEGEWSIKEILQHLLDFELRYQHEFERLLNEQE